MLLLLLLLNVITMPGDDGSDENEVLQLTVECNDYGGDCCYCCS